jgi:hypothetical protein
MTLYLLDANVPIEADESYYPVARIKPFWVWLIEQGEKGIIKIPRLIFNEITPPPGPLAEWLKREDVKKVLVLEEKPDTALVQRVLNEGYAPNLNDVEIQKVGKDPFLVAIALAKPDRVVVTKERSQPSKMKANRKIPDVCDHFGIKWMTDFDLYRVLKFSIP